MPVANYYQGFDVSIHNADGTTSPRAGETIEIHEPGGGSLLDTLTTDTFGNIPDGAIAGLSAGDTIEFSAPAFPGPVILRTVAATIDEAYLLPAVDVHLIVQKDYDQPLNETAIVEIWAQNLSEPEEPPRLVGHAKPGETTKLDYVSGPAKLVRVYAFPRDENGKGAFARIEDAPYEDISIPSLETEIGGGTVTSIAITLPSFLSVSPGSITTSGTFAVSLATQTANKVFASPSSGSPAAPTFRSIVALDLGTSPTSSKWLRGDMVWLALSAADIASGTIATARLGSGTANSGTWLRGDQTWTNPLTVGNGITSGTNGRIFFQSAGLLGQSASLFFDSAGPYLGIGTSSPNLDLHIERSANGVIGFRVKNVNAGSSAQVQNVLENGAGNLAYYIIGGSGFSGYAPLDGGKAAFGGYGNDVAIFTQSAGKRIIFYIAGVEAGSFGSDSKFHAPANAEAFGLSYDGKDEPVLKDDLYGWGASIPFTLFDHYADAGNTTTTETDLYSDTIPAARLAGNGDSLEAEYGGVYVSSATATRQIKIYFGGTLIFDTGALTLSLSSAWTAYVTIKRVSSSVIRYMVSFTTEGAALAAYTATGAVTGLTLSSSQILKISGQAAGIGAATNDIVAKLGSVRFYPHA